VNNIIRDIVGVGQVKGEIGLELEVEGDNLPMDIPKYWRVEGDGSLRGGMEYVLKEPTSREAVDRDLTHLFKAFERNESVLSLSNRTSLHVHLNVQEFTKDQVYNFIILYLILEDALVRWCGEGREGNLFCLRAKDAEYLIDLLEESRFRNKLRMLATDQIRYASINCSALYKYGSLEFRAMRGTDSPEDILKWVNILLRIKDAALTYNLTAQIVDGYSEGGEHYFCQQILGPYFEELCCYEGWEDEVPGGIPLRMWYPISILHLHPLPKTLPAAFRFLDCSWCCISYTLHSSYPLIHLILPTLITTQLLKIGAKDLLTEVMLSPF